MGSETAAAVRITLTREQQEQYFQVCGLHLRELVVSPRHLCALLLYTQAYRQRLLPDAPQLMGTIQLIPEQREVIREATGREATHLTLGDVNVEGVSFREESPGGRAPLRVGRSLVIVPADGSHEGPASQHLIALSPAVESNRAIFGTGMHPTTRLCLTLLEDRLAPGSRVLDLGTGSGVLSIAAARLGAREVLALDIDPIAVATARGNVEANRLAAQIRVRQGSVEAADAAPYDLVLANLLAGLLLPMAPDLARRVRPAGTLIASGIREAASAAVAIAFSSHGFHLEESRLEASWVGLAFRRIS